MHAFEIYLNPVSSLSSSDFLRITTYSVSQKSTFDFCIVAVAVGLLAFWVRLRVYCSITTVQCSPIPVDIGSSGEL